MTRRLWARWKRWEPLAFVLVGGATVVLAIVDGDAVRAASGGFLFALGGERIARGPIPSPRPRRPGEKTIRELLGPIGRRLP